MTHHKQMAKYDALKFINEAVFTVLMIGISTYLATQNIITVGSVLTAYLCFSQLIKPLEELHRILDELSECMVLAEDFFRMTELPSDFSYTPVTESTDIAPVSKEMIDLDVYKRQGISFLKAKNPSPCQKCCKTQKKPGKDCL